MVSAKTGQRPVPPARLQMPRWNLEDAKARLSEVVRCAKETGPQLVTQRGRDAVVVIAASEFAALTGGMTPFVEFMADLNLGDLALDRDSDTGRDVIL
jgi:antitoxin Phd